MTCESVAEVLEESSVFPAYLTVMEWVALLSVVVLKVATPELFSVPVPRVVAPFRKVTVPVGIGPEAAVTVAVNVTLVPAFAGLSEEVTLLVVEAL
jgi:hypothetical protein